MRINKDRTAWFVGAVIGYVAVTAFLVCMGRQTWDAAGYTLLLILAHISLSRLHRFRKSESRGGEEGRVPPARIPK